MLLSLPAWRAAYIFMEGDRPADWPVSLVPREGVTKSWMNKFPAKLFELCSITTTTTTTTKSFVLSRGGNWVGSGRPDPIIIRVKNSDPDPTHS